MRKIIYLPGDITGKSNIVFFLNEINYINDYFDDVIIVSYPGNRKIIDKMSKEYDFRYYVINTRVRSIFSIEFIKWAFSKSTLKEIKNTFSFSIAGLKKLAYIIYYGLFYIETKKEIDNELNNEENSAVYLYSYWLSRGAYVASKYNESRRKKIVNIFSRAHRYDLYENRNSLNFLPFRQYINDNLDTIYFISQDGLEYHKTKYKNISANRRISRLGTHKNNTFKKKIIKKDTIQLVSCSSIISVKRLDLIIEILSKINLDIKWTHIGDGALGANIRALAKRKLRKIDYEFLGYIDNNDILKVYEKLDVDYFINMSDSEGLPVSMMEAMSLGIPVIARNVGGISEIVDRSTGMLIDNIDDLEMISKDISKELEKRFKDIDYYKSKSNNSFIKWNNEFNASSNYNDFFSRVL